MKLLAAVALLLVLVALPAKADKCDALTPTNAQDIDESFRGKLDGEIKGLLGRLAGGSASLDGAYRKIETDELKNYSDSGRLYVWQRIMYLACVSPDLKIDINELFRLYLAGPPKNAGACGPGMEPAAHKAAGIENENSIVGEEYTDTSNGIFNYCTTVGKESVIAPQSENRERDDVYRVPKTDANGIPCRVIEYKHAVDHNTVIGPPEFNPFGARPGTCIAEQIVTDNYGRPSINDGANVTKQTSSGNHTN
jgi:hypothetical protein